MPVPAATLALLALPLPEPAPCPALPVAAVVAADLFGRGALPQAVGLTDPGGPLQRHQWAQAEQLSDRFGDVQAVDQLDRQLGRR